MPVFVPMSTRGSTAPAVATPGHRPRLLVPGLQLLTRAVAGGAHLLAEPQKSDGVSLSPEAARAIHAAGPGRGEQRRGW